MRGVDRRMSNLPIKDIVNVVVEISALGAVRASFDIGLIVGTSLIVSTEDRVMLYTGVEDMVAAGFTAEMPEHKAAVLYFGQSPQPKRLSLIHI